MPEVGPGQWLSRATATWLDASALAAIACCPTTLLWLPAEAYALRLKLTHLRTLSRRARLLDTLPQLVGCSPAALRSLAHAAVVSCHFPGARLAREGGACKGLLVLSSGSAKEKVAVDQGEGSEASADYGAPEVRAQPSAQRRAAYGSAGRADEAGDARARDPRA